MSGRYASRAMDRISEPVAVTCSGCQQPTTGELYVSTTHEPGKPWRTWTLLRCANCGPERRPYIIGGDYAVDYPHVITCAWCRRRCHVERRGRRYCTTTCANRARTKRRRRERALARSRTCAFCHQPFTAPRQDATFCSNAHRQAAYRARQQAAADKAAENARLMADYDHSLWCSCGESAAECRWMRRRQRGGAA